MPMIKTMIFASVLAALAVSQTPLAPGGYMKQAAISEEGSMVRVTANSPRPLEQALEALQQKYGWKVDYEDPQYVAAADLVDAPKGSALSKLPSGGAFSVKFAAATPDAEKDLRMVVDAYNQSKNPGRFVLRAAAGGRFDVVGNAAADDKGAIAPQQVLLDLPITLAAEERNVTDTVNLICEQLAAQSHAPVTLGVTPRKPMDRATVKIGGTKVPARELLVQALRATNQNLYWRLLFDPNSKGYFLDIHSSGPA